MIYFRHAAQRAGIEIPADPILSPRDGRTASREGGSALVLVLLVMMVLTFLGLTLMNMTQVEMKLGGIERVNRGVFYAAEAGTSIATARILTGAVAPTTFLVSDSPESSEFRLGYAVGLSRAIAVTQSPCNFCSANEDQQAWSFKVTYLVSSQATRRDWRSVDPEVPVPVDQATVQARKTITVTYEFQPVEAPQVEAVPTPEESELIEL